MDVPGAGRGAVVGSSWVIGQAGHPTSAMLKQTMTFSAILQSPQAGALQFQTWVATEKLKLLHVVESILNTILSKSLLLNS